MRNVAGLDNRHSGVGQAGGQFGEGARGQGLVAAAPKHQAGNADLARQRQHIADGAGDVEDTGVGAFVIERSLFAHFLGQQMAVADGETGKVNRQPNGPFRGAFKHLGVDERPFITNAQQRRELLEAVKGIPQHEGAHTLRAAQRILHRQAAAQ